MGTLNYYDENADDYILQTRGVDMAALHARFLQCIPHGGHILDAGCGSGRDSRDFLERGYRVTAIDASPAMAALATGHIGQPAQLMRFEDFDWIDAFDGIWACASLLHVRRTDLPDVMRKLVRAMKPGGVLYLSFKYGDGERLCGGRRFTDLDEPGLDALVATIPDLRFLERWFSTDQRPGRSQEVWLNALLVRQSQT